ncbi:DinB family protein [Parapedobacter sp. DT-150]|uniref:DinB family protein n=1 Tax=Parapedobacter sp. DT-150 TaxID=3396162 RepID=UPI003F1ADD12
MTNAFFEELFTYSRYCNQRLAAVLMEPSTAVDQKSISLFSHILNAHQIWNSRIQQQPSTHGVWEIRPLGEWAEIDLRNYDQTLGILKTCVLTDPVAYTTSNGQPFTNTVGDILFHIINHSTYHRGQLALLFRQQGLEPLLTDYIFYKR